MRARVYLRGERPPSGARAREIDSARGDLTDAGGVDTLALSKAEELSISVALADET